MQTHLQCRYSQITPTREGLKHTAVTVRHEKPLNIPHTGEQIGIGTDAWLQRYKTTSIEAPLPAAPVLLQDFLTFPYVHQWEQGTVLESVDVTHAWNETTDGRESESGDAGFCFVFFSPNPPPPEPIVVRGIVKPVWISVAAQRYCSYWISELRENDIQINCWSSTFVRHKC